MPTKRFHSDSFYGQNSGIEYHFELHDMSYSGSSTKVELDKPGAIIDWSQDSNIYSVIRASKCNVTIKVTNSTIETAIMNLIAKQDKTVYILIYKGADIYWGGALNSQGIQFEQNSNPPYIKLEAMDWLGGLQNVIFDPANFIHLVPGYNKFTDFLTEFFLQAYPLGNQFYMPSNKLFSTASPIYNSVTSDADDLWYNTQASTLAFTDEKGRYTLTYHQVLENFLTIINSKVLYSNGIYRVVDIRFYNYPGDWTEYFYNDIGNQTSQLDYDNTITYDGDDYEWSVDPLLEVEVALKKAQITFRNPSTLRTNPEEGAPIFQVTSPYMTDRFGLGLITSYLNYFVPDIIPNTGDKVEVVFDIDVTDPALLKKCKWVYLVMEVTDGTSSYWLNNKNVNPTGVDPYTCTPADTNWLNLPNGYVIMPFNGGQKSRYRVIMDLPFAINNISRFEVNLGGDYIYKKGNTVNGSGYITNIDTNGLRASAFGDVINIVGTGLSPILSYIVQLFPSNKYLQLSYNATLNQTQAEFRIWAVNDVFVSGDEGKINIDIQVNYLIGGSSTDAEGMKYEATNSNQANTIYEAPDTYIGDATGATKNNRALKVFNGAFWLNSLNNWRYKPLLYSDTEDFLLQKLVNSFLEHRADPLKLYSGILFIRNEYKPHQAIYFTINSVSYILFFNGGSFSLDTDEWSGQWVIINRNVGTLSATTKKVGTKITTKDIYKDVYPYIDVPILDNDIRVIGDIIGTSGGAFAMVKSAIILNAETMGNYTASDPEFTFQSTGSTAVVTNAKDGDIIVTNENGKFWKVVQGAAQEQFEVNKVEPQVANRVYAGPTTGAAANPTFRALVADDLGSGGNSANYLRGDMTWATMIAGVTAIGTIDSVSPKVANGAQISGSNLIMQTADSSYPGLVSIGTQTFAGAKTLSNNAHTSLNISGTWTSSASNQSHMVVSPNITADANNRVLNAININPTMSVGGFTGVSLNDVNLNRNNPIVNFASGNLSLNSSNVAQFIIRGGGGGTNIIKLKVGQSTLSGTVTNSLDVGGDSLFSSAQATPATAGARVDIVGASASTGSALIVKNSTPTTLFEIKNNQDIQLGSSGGKIGLFAVTPIVRPTTSIGSATIVSPGGGINIKTDDTFDGYTLAKVVKALRDLGILT